MNNVIIIGGGAAGLTAAINAAGNGASVTVLEHKDRVGKKILNTGNGRCNITNDIMSPDKYYGDESSFAWRVISECGNREALNFFSGLGVTYKNRDGYIYPRSEQASSVLDLLRAACAALKVNIVCDSDIKKIDFQDNDFSVETSKGAFKSDRLILAAGGMSYSSTGSDGSAYKFLKGTLHRITPMVPALTGLISCEKIFKSIAGVRCFADVGFTVGSREVYRESGELQLTDYGCSGIPIFNGSRFVSRGLYEHKKCYIDVDFMPEYSIDNITATILENISSNPSFTAYEMLIGMINKKIAQFILKRSGIERSVLSGSLKEKDVNKIVFNIKNFNTEIIKVNSFDRAQVTCGGVVTDDICPDTLESKHIKGLYIIGEMLDVDGMCGGYNLQFSWSTGILAGRHSAKDNNYKKLAENI